MDTRFFGFFVLYAQEFQNMAQTVESQDMGLESLPRLVDELGISPRQIMAFLIFIPIHLKILKYGMKK